MSQNIDAFIEMRKTINLGGGAQFHAYVSPSNHTSDRVTHWQIKLEQADGNWVGVLTSDHPTQTLQTPNLSGLFNVTVTASGPGFSQTPLTPLADSQPNIGCNSNCYGIIGIIASTDGKNANYWTVWDAACK